MKKIKRWFLNWTWELEVWIKNKRGKWIDWGRRGAGYPVQCEDCGHVCRLRDCRHTYRADGEDDVEAIDECPRCGSEEIL